MRTVKRPFTSILCILLCFAMLISCETAVATVLACEKDTSNVLADSASYEYDNALRLSAVTNYDVTSGEALYTVSYTYDENGNRVNEKSTSGTEVYYLYNDANLVHSNGHL